MMQQGNWQQGNSNCHQGNMMGGNQVRPVVCPTQYRCHDKFVPREVPFIHPIVNVNRVHTVEIPRHYFTETTQNVMGQTLPARPGFGPGMGRDTVRGWVQEWVDTVRKLAVSVIVLAVDIDLAVAVEIVAAGDRSELW